jgi:hypothetical protein
MPSIDLYLLSSRDDAHPKVGSEREEVVVTSNNALCPRAFGALQNRPIFRITTDSANGAFKIHAYGV